MDVVLIVIILSLSLLVMLKRKKRQNPPPGPTGYPLLGNTFNVDAARLHLSLTKWAQMYGDIYEVELFGNTVVVLNSPEIIRKAFLTEPNATLFSGRVEGSIMKEILYGPKDIAFGTYSELWTKRRKLGHKILRAFGVGMKEIEKSITEELAYVTSKMKNYNGSPFDPEVLLNNFLNQLIAILLTGRRHGEANKEMIDAISSYDKCINEILDQQVSFLIDWLPFMRYVPSRASRVYYATKRSQKVFEKCIQEEKKSDSSKGMIHALYEEMEHLLKSNSQPKWLTEESIFAILTNMASAGILTSQGTLLIAIRILLERKDIQRKLQSEVDQIVGSHRSPSLMDRKNMSYLEAFLLEVLRYGTNLPIGVPHKLMDDATLKGYDLKKDSMVITNLWKINHDESIFPEPYEFKPERFLNENGELLHGDVPGRQNLLSFGIGKRSCIGESFARNRMFLFLATMMQNFTFEPETEDIAKFDPCDMQTTLVRFPHHYKCRVERRFKQE